MRTKYFLVGCALTVSVGIGGCSNDDSPDSETGCPTGKSWGEQTQEEADAVAAAATTFATEPSKASCENFRAAYIDYIEALEEVNTCILEENEAAFLKALEDGKTELDNIDCNQNFDP